MATDAQDARRVLPIRSLCMVGPEESKIHAAADAGCDVLWLDLEEPQWPFGDRARNRAREVYADYLGAAGHTGPRVFVRVSHPRHGETMADLRSVVGPHLSGVIAPKADGPEDIHMLEGLLFCAEHEAGLAPGRLQILPLLESAAAVRRAYDIATASPRVAYMYSGLSKFGDVARELGYEWTPTGEETLYFRSKVLLDARAAGIRYPIAAAWRGAASDRDGFDAWARAQRRLGFFGMNTRAEEVERAHAIFTPSADQVAYWERLVTSAEKALADGTDSIAFGDPDGTPGPMREAFVESARWNLAWARDLGIYNGEVA
jgi:citrate lyase subunit beta / citryl-CoA lyase